jgi:hypothetical protein
MSYVIESGPAERSVRDWLPVESIEGGDKPARDYAYERMVSYALASEEHLYEPHGGRKLRVREIEK